MKEERGKKKGGPTTPPPSSSSFFVCCRCSFVGSKKSKSYEWPRLASDHVPIQVQNGDGGGLSKASLAKNLIWLCSQLDKSPKARPSVHCTTTLERREAGGKRTDEVIQVVIPFQPFPFFFLSCLTTPPPSPSTPEQTKKHHHRVRSEIGKQKALHCLLLHQHFGQKVISLVFRIKIRAQSAKQFDSTLLPPPLSEKNIPFLLTNILFGTHL